MLPSAAKRAAHSIESILRKLRKMRIDAHPSELFSAPLATKAYIQSKQWRPYLLIHQAIVMGKPGKAFFEQIALPE